MADFPLPHNSGDHPSTQWNQVARDLEDMKLSHLLELSALLSADDTLGGTGWAEANSFNCLHPALLQNFTRVILECPATFRNVAVPSHSFILRYLVETIGRLQDHPQLQKIPKMSVQQLNTDALAPMWRQQSRIDGRNYLDDLARNYAILNEFSENIQDEIQEKLKSGYVNLNSHFKMKYGCSTTTIILGTLLIYTQFSQIFNEAAPFNPPWLQERRRGGPAMKLTATDLERYVQGAAPHFEQLYFTEEQVTSFLTKYLPENELPALLSLMSASLEEMRTMLTQPPYSEGMAAFAPLPLELKPLLKLPDGRLLIVNLRSFLVGLARLPLTLLSTDTERVKLMNNYGYALEAYAEALTADRLKGSTVVVVPEFAYHRPGTHREVRSADLTLLEKGQPITLVEIKAKRLPDLGIAQAGTAPSKDLATRITETVLKGQVKASHLPDVLHADLQPALAEVSEDTPLIVVVYGETVANFDGVFRHLIRNPGHALETHLGHFVALSIAEYEQHLDLAFETGASAISLLGESAREFATRDGLQMTSHLHLGNRRANTPYVERYLKILLSQD